MVCQAFPSDMADGVLHLQANIACSCRTWTLTDVDLAEETTVVTERQADSEEYCRVVADWNEYMAAQPEGTTTTFADYCAYVLERYDELAADASQRSTA